MSGGVDRALLFDIGNTRVKWGILDHGELKRTGSIGHDRLKVTASARVLGDAIAGGRVLAEYDATGAVLLTEVQPDGTLRVLRRASRGERP